MKIPSFSLAMAVILTSSAQFQSTSAAEELELVLDQAPIAPNSTVAGALTDFLVFFADPDPAVPGIEFKAGGSVSLTFPDDFVRTDPSARTRLPLLRGWPQAPYRPLPDISYDEDTNTLTGTTPFDILNDGPENPGAKHVHAILEGWTNPSPGKYTIGLSIKPDPDDDAIMTGTTTIKIIPRARAIIFHTSVVNGPPPFPNSMYQTIQMGEIPLPWGFYLWDDDNVPYLGVTLVERNSNTYAIQTEEGEGTTVGKFKIQAPPGATDYYIESDVSVSTTASGLGLPSGLLTAQFYPDPDVSGEYVIRYGMNGNSDSRFLFLTVLD